MPTRILGWGIAVASGAYLGALLWTTALAQNSPDPASTGASPASTAQAQPQEEQSTTCNLPWSRVAQGSPDPSPPIVRVGRSSYQVGGETLVTPAPFPEAPKFTSLTAEHPYALEGPSPPLAVVKDTGIYATDPDAIGIKPVRPLVTAAPGSLPTWAFEVPGIGVVAGGSRSISFAKYGSELKELEKHQGQPDLPEFNPTPPYGGFLISPREGRAEKGQKLWWIGASPRLLGLYKSVVAFSGGVLTYNDQSVLTMLKATKDGPATVATSEGAQRQPFLALEGRKSLYLVNILGVSELSTSLTGKLLLTERLKVPGGFDFRTNHFGWQKAVRYGRGKAVLRGMIHRDVVDAESFDQPMLLTGSAGDEEAKRLGDLSRDKYPIAGFGALLHLGREMGFEVTVPWSQARISYPDFVGETPKVSELGRITIRIEHPCIGETTPLRLQGVAPDGSALLPREEGVALSYPRDGAADATVNLRVFQSKSWKLQFITTRTKPRKVGPSLEILVEPKNRTFEEVGKWASYVIPVLLVLANLLVLALARYNATAWRIATSNSKATLAVRFGTMLLSHARFVQLWVLDLYFQYERCQLQKQSSILPLPLTSSQWPTIRSTDLLEPPWTESVGARRIAIVGATGMGKSTLLRWLHDAYFSRSPTSFKAAEHDQVVMAFIKARQFDGTTFPEGEANERWVVEAIRGTLAPSGLSFEDVGLLRLMLRTGTIGVVIDGLHEAGSRVPAVNAFAREFPKVPLVVTMQTPPEMPSFEIWKLPVTMVEHVSELLALLLGDQKLAHAADEAITFSGLKATLLSGYDVRLIQQLTATRGGAVNLPGSRAGLYGAAWQAAWHDDPRASEEQASLEALAWKMTVSRDAHQRRLLSDKDSSLPLKLLNKLSAELPSGDSRTRIIVRVDGGYEFVHDQMVAYLAATYLVHTGHDAKGLVQLLEESKLEGRPPAEIRPLWNFLAIVLLRETRCALLQELTPANFTEADRWGVVRHVLEAQARTEDANQGGLPSLE